LKTSDFAVMNRK